MSVRALLAALAVEVLAFGVLGMVILDLRLHSRFEQVAGVNVQGYRGPLQPRRRPRERRLLLAGDSTAFGYGVAWTESFGFYLSNRLRVERNRAHPDSVVKVINAATIPDGAHALPYAVREFRFVEPDVVIIDAGYDALCEGCPDNTRLAARIGAVRRLRLHADAATVPSGEGRSPRVIRRPCAARFTGRLRSGSAARALAAADRVPAAPATRRARSATSAARLGGSPSAARFMPPSPTACRMPETSSDDAAKSLSDTHREQQRAMAAMLRREFGGDGRVVYLDEGDAVDLRDRAMSFDGVHLTADGNQRLAESLMPPLRTCCWMLER